MTSRDPNQLLDREPGGEDEEEGLDFEQVRERLGFAVRAPWRHPRLAAGVFLLVAAAGITVAVTMPRTYNAQVRVLVQHNLVGAALTNPKTTMSRETENPTKTVGEVIMRRDNLVALAKDVDLVNRFYGSRSAALRLKDFVLGGPKDDEERLLALTKTLQKRLYVNTDESTVTVVIDWSDPQMAYDLVTRVQENLLDAKYDDQVAMINDALAILQEHEKTERQNVDVALDEYQKIIEEQRLKLIPAGRQAVALPRPVPVAILVGGGGGGSAPAPHASLGGPVDPDLVAALEEKRRQVKSLEEERQREIEGLKQQLAQAELTLTPQHPTVQTLQQQVEARSKASSPELAKARSEERDLVARIAAASEAPPAGSSQPLPTVRYQPSPVAAANPFPAIPPLPRELETDGRTLLARTRLDEAMRSYDDVQGRIATANMELEIAHSVFKYRYTVAIPAEVPKGPKKPIAPLIGVGSVAIAALLAILIAVVADLLRGRVLESWQVRRRLKLDVLGELDAP
jgi:uncharacterized protein involved in exopolysaccharide biosynthesis